MTRITYRLTAMNRDQLRNPTLGNRVWASFLVIGYGTHGTPGRVPYNFGDRGGQVYFVPYNFCNWLPFSPDTAGSLLCFRQHIHTHTDTHPFNGTLSVSRYQKGKKPIWILLKQETVSGSGISWAICKSAHRSRRITTPAPHHSVFTGWMPFLPPNQQCQSTEGTANQPPC